MRTFIGSIGTRDSQEHSLGQLVSERLRHDAPIAAAGVVVEDLSSDPVEIAERLSNEWPQFERVILVGSVARSRPAGTVAAYRLDGGLSVDEPTGHDGDDEVPLENTLRAIGQMADLPGDIIVVEVEPDQTETGHADSPSPALSRAVDQTRALVRRLATNRRAGTDLPRSALGTVPERRELAD